MNGLLIHLLLTLGKLAIYALWVLQGKWRQVALLRKLEQIESDHAEFKSFSLRSPQLAAESVLKGLKIDTLFAELAELTDELSTLEDEIASRTEECRECPEASSIISELRAERLSVEAKILELQQKLAQLESLDVDDIITTRHQQFVGEIDKLKVKLRALGYNDFDRERILFDRRE